MNSSSQLRQLENMVQFIQVIQTNHNVNYQLMDGPYDYKWVWSIIYGTPTYLASCAFFSLHTDSAVLFFFSVVDRLSADGFVSVGGPVLTIMPACAHWVAFLMAIMASSVVISARPFYKDNLLFINCLK